MLRSICYGWCVLAMLAAASAPAYGQPRIVLAEPKPGTEPRLVPVPAPSARAVALSEALGLLAFAHDRSYPDAQVTLVKLDAKGNPAVYGTAWKLPRPDALAKAGNYALSVAFHPKLPLLYVWQDVGLHFTNPVPPQPPEAKLFDHLFIYRLSKDPPELVVSLCRNTDDFIFGAEGGALALDKDGQFLYVPNLRDPKNAGSYRFGRFRLDVDGLPEYDAADAKLPLPARVKKLALQNANKGTAPAELTPIEYVNVFPGSRYGTGHSFLSIGPNAVVAGGAHGLIAWRPADKQAEIEALPLTGYGPTLLTAHPRLPLLFATVGNTDSFYRVSQVDSYLSLLPMQVKLPDRQLCSAPIVIAREARIAVGGRYFVYFVALDADGMPRPEVRGVRVLAPEARALVYSEKFDRLYVGVEVSK